MKASPFESEAPLGSRRAIIRRNPRDMQEIEMIEARWGLEPSRREDRPFKFVRAEGRNFPTQRCLIAASEFEIRKSDRRYRVALEDGNFFYLAGIWRRAPDSAQVDYAVLTIDANPDVAPYQERQGVVLRRRQNMAWLDLTVPEEELLRALPPRSFAIQEIAPREPKAHQSELVY